MAREIACPRCGAGHHVANPGITMLVCTSCHSVVYWDVDGAIKLGAESILPASQSRLFLFADGTLDGRPYQVIGHVRYDYGRGNWDEWLLSMADGSTLWVSEDERVLTEEVAIDPAGAPTTGSVRVGDTVTLAGVDYSVRELATATCVGGEGQLPFTLEPGSVFNYIDLASADGRRFATLEYHSDGVQAYAGQVLSHERLSIHGTPPPATTQHQGEGINCTNCGANLQLPADRQVTTRVCEYCGTQLDLSTTEHAILGHNPRGVDAPVFLLEVGQAGTFDGARYEVAGRVLYLDPENYESREYLLFNPDRGYLWLAQYNGHYHLLSEAHAEPSPFSYYPKASTEVDGRHYRVYEWGSERVGYVDGALPWKAFVGQHHQVCTLIDPPHVYEIEGDGNETEFFKGRYLPVEELWQAFELDGDPVPGSGVGAAEPYVRSFALKWLMIAAAVGAIVNAGLYLWGATQKPTVIADVELVPDLEVREVYSEPFDVEPGQILSAEIAPASGSPWSNMAVDFVAHDDPAIDTARRRAEGKNKPDALFNARSATTSPWRYATADQRFRAPPTAGRYRIHLDVTLGSAYQPTSVSGTDAQAITARRQIADRVAALDDAKRTVRVRLLGNVVTRGSFVLALFLCLAVLIFGAWRKLSHEGARWRPVLEDE